MALSFKFDTSAIQSINSKNISEEVSKMQKNLAANLASTATIVGVIIIVVGGYFFFSSYSDSTELQAVPSSSPSEVLPQEVTLLQSSQAAISFSGLDIINGEEIGSLEDHTLQYSPQVRGGREEPFGLYVTP